VSLLTLFEEHRDVRISVVSSTATSLVPTPRHPAGDVATRIADINTANSNGQSNTINLRASTYNLTTINNFCVVALDGVLPSAVMARTAHGLLASGVQLGLSASCTQVVETIDAQRLVVSA
jgi:hypothetical protein